MAARTHDDVPRRGSRDTVASLALGSVAVLAGTTQGCAMDDAADTVAPRVVATAPDDGDTWDRFGEIRFEFSEPMAAAAGTIELFLGPESAPVTVRGSWEDRDRTRFAAWSTEVLPQNAEVVVVADGFSDVAGLPQLAPSVLELRTLDDASPVLLRTAPEDGAEVAADSISEVVFEVDEPLDGAHGRVEVEGYGLETGPIRWGLGGRQMRVPVSGLRDEASYRVTLRGFRDHAGHGTPAMSVAFHTIPDRVGPGVVDAWPAEGEVVDAAAVDAIRVTFDETMRSENNRSTLTVAGEPRAVWGTWEDARRTFVVVPDPPLPPGVSVSLSVAGLVDRLGNAVDAGPVLVDGRLDFTTR